MLNHKMLICSCLLLLFSIMVSADVEPQEAVLLKHVNEQNLDGAGLYETEVEVSNGIKSSAKGNVNGVQGEYFLPSEDGKPPVRVTYTADATGFHPEVHN